MYYFLAFFFLLSSGCATVINGTTQDIGVASTPIGADVLVDNQHRLITPSTINLARSQSHTFLFSKTGYHDDSFVITSGTSGWVWGNILLGGIIGGVVDFASGSARKLSQDSIHVTLQPVIETPVAPVSLVPAVVVEQD